METVTKAHEDAFLRCVPGRTKCASDKRCKGVTARTVHNQSFGSPLDAFVLPSGNALSECVLCIRARVSKEYYHTLYTKSFPTQPIHPYVVQVDTEEAYDAALCIGPLDMEPTSERAEFVGVVGPFLRYDETCLRVVDDGFEQLHMDFKRARFGDAYLRVGARPLGFYDLYRTQSALLLAGFVCDVPKRDGMPIVSVYTKCLPHANVSSVSVGVFDNLSIHRWLAGIRRIGSLGLYPHCESFGQNVDRDAKTLFLLMREHVTFLIERDSPELYEAVVRAHPTWPEFVKHTREACDQLRSTNELPRSALSAFTKHTAGVPVSHPPFTSCAISGEPLEWYVCTKCGKFKSDMQRGGCVDVCVDLETGVVLCYKKRPVGRKPLRTMLEANPDQTTFERAGCFGVVQKIEFGNRIVDINGVARAACVKCRQAHVPIDWQRIVGGLLCDACNVRDDKIKCEVCGVKCGKDGFSIRAFKTNETERDVWFCRAHTSHRLKQHAEVWSYELLMEAATSAKRPRRR